MHLHPGLARVLSFKLVWLKVLEVSDQVASVENFTWENVEREGIGVISMAKRVLPKRLSNMGQKGPIY